MNAKDLLKKLAGPKKRLRACGVMSGTSADGIDAAVVDITPGGITLRAFETVPYPPKVRRTVLAAAEADTGRVDTICQLNFQIGELFAEAVTELVKTGKIPLHSINVIGSHGQTIHHLPHRRQNIPSTLQIGEPSVIAERTGITTVADFRPRDIAAGGQGAPLVPFADFVLHADAKTTRAVQNIGGIANVTYLPAGGSLEDVIAFDTGPGNMVLDALCERLTHGRSRYDANGRRAARGSICRPMLREWLRHAYFHRRPPKTTGREAFGAAFADKVVGDARRRKLSPEDTLATATALTAESIANAYRRFLPHLPAEVILCGGGAHNATLVGRLREALAPAVLRTTDELGIPADAKEAVAFALLGAATLRGIPSNVPAATGASRPVLLGKIVNP